jgi:Flp pilus assembly protein TadD
MPTTADAVRHYDQGNRDAARAACEQILASGSTDNDARLLLAILLIEDGDAVRGLSLLQLIVASAPDNARARHALGKALARLGRTAEAIEQLEKAIALQPANIDAYLDLSGVHLRGQQVKDAERILRQAHRIAPQHPVVLGELGALLAAHGDADAAIQLLRQAAAALPQSAPARCNLGVALRNAGRLDEAIAQYRAATALKSDYVEAWQNWGHALLDAGDVTGAADAYEAGVQIRRRPGAGQAGADVLARINPGKLRHDIEQLRYLIDRGRLPPQHESLIADYEAALAALPANMKEPASNLLPSELRARMAPYYNRLLFRPSADRVPGGAVNPRLDVSAIETDYRRNVPGITFADGFLTPDGLASLRRFCLEATVWFESRPANGGLGAVFDDGFCCPLLLQIADELRQTLPGIFGLHTLRKLWASKHDNHANSSTLHVASAITVNFWVTPDDANRDPTSGGMTVWDKPAPSAGDAAKGNNDPAALRRFLAETQARAINIPHRQNRVVILGAGLIHETAAPSFRDGYENRRVGITMLYDKGGPPPP